MNGQPTCVCSATESRPPPITISFRATRESNPFSSFSTPPMANDATSPIQTQNLGTDNRDVTDIALKVD